MSERDEEKYRAMDAFRCEADDMPDGAFFAFAEERGWTAEDWVWFSEEYERRHVGALYLKGDLIPAEVRP